MSKQDERLKALIKEVVQEELCGQQVLNEGFFRNLRKAVDFASKIAYVQATRSSEGIRHETIDALVNFIQKAKSKSRGFLADHLLHELEQEVTKIQVKYKKDFIRYRDELGRFASHHGKFDL